ncbi:SDR family oxidoreductase [Micromonospora polyrhachis]|uniref:NAD(P)-dependent dehydrogenase (Short-subunit alcohol dehydrogenase family) n=1 Tax=Micromonospora polyrhachis TaxID=1282883 RepID=A0A7W7SQ43_9ACTN|nr:SDR family oxidoreductase [Micromonospora polyrhachis]MBB4958884.1 NAD(P)-dependent dehydrogenase (short-subunit alcohol dehydrogenase family) [Micromonospora polyrhachis]
MQLDGKVAIVTGGATGIGGAVSRVFVRRGAKVVAVDTNPEAGNALAAELGERVAFLHGDVRDPDIAPRAVSIAVERFGLLTTLINNAHASRQAPFTDLTDDQWALSFGTGFEATKRFMLAAYPELRKQGGSVVNFASGAGLLGQVTQASYASAKEAIRGLSRVVANEWANENIRVNVVSPAALTSGVKAWREAFPELYAASVGKIPLGRFGDPEEDVAPIVAFLASDDSKYMTGQTLMADGGGVQLR